MAKKKSTAKKPATKVAAKAVAKKSGVRVKTGTASIQMLSAKPSTRRPPSNPDMPRLTIAKINYDLVEIRDTLDEYSQHLRALDRMRLNGVGIHKLGFIERAYELALENSEFLPHYLTIERFGKDITYFIDFRTLVDLCDQIREKLWNITLQSADIAYTDALEFYASVREAAKRRVDAAETIHSALSVFFRHHRTPTEETTVIKAKKDFGSLIHGRHDGKLVIENISPKLTGGKRKIIDKTFKDTERFKETETGEFTE